VHQSQINEWLPGWRARHRADADSRPEAKAPRALPSGKRGEFGLPADRAFEVFTATAWGIVPSVEQLARDLPLANDPARRARLADRLARWR